MDINWSSIFLGWLVGIASTIVGELLLHRYLRWRKRKGEYLTTTVSNDAIEFEGRVWHNTAMVSTMQEILKQVLGINAPPIDTKPRKRKV